MNPQVFGTAVRRTLMLAILSGLAAPAAGEEWKSLFDGKTLGKWEVIEKHSFKEHGPVEVKDGAIVLGEGRPATGIRWTGEFPKINYEVTLEAKRIEGNDFFCGVTFPVGKSPCTLILGGWGGTAVGLSNIDNNSAIENETTQFRDFKRDRWYAIRLASHGREDRGLDRQGADHRPKDPGQEVVDLVGTGTGVTVGHRYLGHQGRRAEYPCPVDRAEGCEGREEIVVRLIAGEG